MLHHLNATVSLPERVVVMGAAGFIGAALMRRLHAAKAPALGLTRAQVDLQSAAAADCLASQLRPTDALVAVAARAPCKDIAMMIENMAMTKAMMDALTRVPVSHVVNISSDAVYADKPIPLTEASPTAPTTMHGAMHLAREIAFAASNAPLAILRPSLLYGADDPHNGYGPNRFRRSANAGQDIVLFGDGEERRDHVLVDDAAEVIFRVLQRRSTGTLNIASGEVRSFREIAERVVALAPRKVELKSTPRNGPMPHNGYRPFDIAACRRAFPDFIYQPIDTGLALAQRKMARA